MKSDEMAKRRRKPRRNVRRAGEDFGEWIEQRAKEFAEEIEGFGERIGRRFERRGKGRKAGEREMAGNGNEWWFRTFGFVGPLLGSFFGIVFIAFGLWLLNLFNIPLGSGFLASLSGFLLRNIHWFFAFFLFFGYSDYFSKRFPSTYWLVSPIITSIGAVIFIWVSVWALNAINVYFGSSLLSSVSGFLYRNLWEIFYAFIILGYAIIFIKKFVQYSLRK